jgi:flagellar biosynthesis protein FliQ
VNAPEVLDVGRDAILTMLKMSTPVMLISLGVGLVIALFQALTQIQEMTLTFVPKILAIFLSLILLFPFMLSTLGTFTEEMFGKIAGGG